MKKMLGLVTVFGVILSAAVFSQTADYAFSAVIREAESFVNGCGPADKPKFSAMLNWLSSSYTSSACNQHDIAYGTLGVSRSEADNNLYQALKVDSWREVPAVASGFWATVRSLGESAYSSAQRQSRQEFKNIHHGNEWSSSYGRWHPSMGHVRMSFPQCTPSCSYY
jgi:hypothetical protein